MRVLIFLFLITYSEQGRILNIFKTGAQIIGNESRKGIESFRNAFRFQNQQSPSTDQHIEITTKQIEVSILSTTSSNIISKNSAASPHTPGGKRLIKTGDNCVNGSSSDSHGLCREEY